MDNFLKKLNFKNKTTNLNIKQSIIRLEKLLEKTIEKINLSDISNVSHIVDLLTSNYTLNSTISTLSNIKKLIKYNLNGSDKVLDEYNVYISELVLIRNKEKETQDFKSEAEQENFIPYPELKKIIIDKSTDYLENTHSFTSYRNFLILALYVLMPPTRISNYSLMKIKNSTNMKRRGQSLPKLYNYIIKISNNNYDLIFNNYKTAENIGQIYYSVESNLLNKLIDKYLTNYNNKPTQSWFMINADGKKMKTNNYSSAVKSISKKITGKELTVNILRRIFITHFLSLNPPFLHRQEILKIMGQNTMMTTADKYVRNVLGKGPVVISFD